MKPIRTLIVDDEPIARRTLRLLLRDEEDVTVVGECGSGPEAVSALREKRPDLLFLDVQMPGMNGFEVLEELGDKELPVVVFVTAYDEYALRAFEVHAVDYLLKPFDDERFARALCEAKTRLRHRDLEELGHRMRALLEEQGRDEPASQRDTSVQRLMIKTGGRVVFLKTEEIDWIEAADYYVRLHVGQARYLLRESMNRLEKRLDPRRFARIHRSTLVNLDRVKELQPYFKGDYVVVLEDDTRLKMSRSRRRPTEQALRRLV